MFEWIKGLFKKELKEGKIIDFRTQYWGHAINFISHDDRAVHSVCGHCSNPSIEVGDLILYEATKGLAVWQFLEVEYERDPRDFFSGKVGIIRYATEADIENIYVYKGLLV